MSLVELYYYLFYKIHQFFERFLPSGPSSKFKATISLTFLEGWLVFSILNYWDVYQHKTKPLNLFSLELLIPLLIIFLIKVFAFIRDERWENYANKFDQWPEEKNRKGTLIVITFFLLIIISTIISMCLYSELS